jgi:hypothetical protein
MTTAVMKITTQIYAQGYQEYFGNESTEQNT